MKYFLKINKKKINKKNTCIAFLVYILIISNVVIYLYSTRFNAVSNAVYNSAAAHRSMSSSYPTAK